MASDIELLQAWRDGDRSAGEQLFERYYDAVYRFFRHKLEDDVSDLVQQTFFALVEGIDRVRQSASFRSYLFAIATNLFRAHLRRQYKEGPAIDFAEVSLQALAPGPSTAYARQRERRLLLEALRRIPIDHQVLLELRYWENMKTAEIAEVLAVPHPTVRSRLRRAHELLEQAIAELTSSSREWRHSLTTLQDWIGRVQEELDESWIQRPE